MESQTIANDVSAWGRPAAEEGLHPIIKTGRTCWRVALADRLAFLVDFQAYFKQAKAAIEGAQRSVMVLGWEFDPRTRLEIAPGSLCAQLAIGELLNGLKARKPELDIRILIWDVPLPIALTQHLFPQRSKAWLDRGIQFHLDSTPPYGASRHQKLLIVDDAIAFCSGGDFAADRLDTPAHVPQAPWRRFPEGRPYPARHDVAMAVSGDAARALGELARERWARATGAPVDPPSSVGQLFWPDGLAADMTAIPVAIARTEPRRGRRRRAVRESEALHIHAIHAAREHIYIENQYFASPLIAHALAARLAEADGPEITLVLSGHSPSYFDRTTMDNERILLLDQLRRADPYGRLGAFTPQTRDGGPLIVHSKLAIIDGRFLRIGSSNINNRSFGFDTECDLAVEARPGPAGEADRAAIRVLRTALLAHFIGCAPGRFDENLRRHGRVNAAIAAMNEDPDCCLKPFSKERLGLLASALAKLHLGDPTDVSDSWQPWLRHIRLNRAYHAYRVERSANSTSNGR